MQLKNIVLMAFSATFFSSAIAAPSPGNLVSANDLSLYKRQDCQCAVCDVGPGDCTGDDLEALRACQKVVLGQCGRSCLDLEPGTGAQDGCLASRITTNKPCENSCVQKLLREACVAAGNC